MKQKKIVGTVSLEEALEQFVLESCPNIKRKLLALKAALKMGELDWIQYYDNYSDFCLDYDSEDCEPPLTKEEFDSLKAYYEAETTTIDNKEYIDFVQERIYEEGEKK